jgi:tetratricopeptide (TPR) repeat protein
MIPEMMIHRIPGEIAWPFRAHIANIVLLIGLFLTTVPVYGYAQTAELNTYSRHVKNGADLLHKGDYRAARDAFEEALRYQETDPAAHLGLGIASFHLRDDGPAERELRRAAELDAKGGKTAHRVLGDLYYRRDDLEAALASWERALERDPGDSELRARIERVRREHRTEKDFNRDVTSHFSIKYEGRERIEAGRIVLRILEDAYGDVGRALGFYPDREIAVILYSDRQFQEVTDAPGWSAGLFDGKIRIPIGGIEAETPGLRRVLVHEYSHAAVRAITARVPAWLNEGLAQHFEGREIGASQRGMLARVAREGRLPPLHDLEGSFMGLSGGQASAAYLLSLSVVRHIVDQYGMYRARMMLDELAGGADTPKAVNNALLVSYEEFEQGWKRSLE